MAQVSVQVEVFLRPWMFTSTSWANLVFVVKSSHLSAAWTSFSRGLCPCKIISLHSDSLSPPSSLSFNKYLLNTYRVSGTGSPVTRQLRPQCPRVWDQALEADLLIKQSTLSYIPGEYWVRGSFPLHLPSSWSFPPQLGRLGIHLYFTVSVAPSSLWPTVISSFSHSIVPWTKTAVHTSVRKLIFCFWSLSKQYFFKKIQFGMKF